MQFYVDIKSMQNITQKKQLEAKLLYRYLSGAYCCDFENQY